MLSDKDLDKADTVLSDLWNRLGDIPVDNDGNTEKDFILFKAGTDRETIWHWFEDSFDCSVAELMYKKKEVSKNAYRSKSFFWRYKYDKF